jgi:hypothetical protein
MVDLIADPAKVRLLPDSALVDLLAQADHLRVELHAEALRRELAHNAMPTVPAPTPAAPDDDGRPFSTAELARRWGKPPAYVAELCRTGRLPGAIRKKKEWLIPRAAEAAWFTTDEAVDDAVDRSGSVALPSPHDPHSREARASVARPVAVTIRRVARRSRDHDQTVGGGKAGHAPLDGQAHPARRRDTGPGSPSA